MKLVIWNVNGLRAALRKGIWVWVRGQQPDYLCLQETRMFPHQLPEGFQEELGGYEHIWNPAEKPGYSGVATFYLAHPESFGSSLGEERFDREGRLIRFCLRGTTFYNVYFPNGKRDHSRVPYKLGFYQRLLQEIDEIHQDGGTVVIGGDFNTAHREIDLRHAKANRQTTGFLDEERAWIDRYLDHGLVDIFRYLYPERIQYTWWTYRMNARERNVGWRLDYFLISESLAAKVQDVVIFDQVRGSDHCPVALEIEI